MKNKYFTILLLCGLVSAFATVGFGQTTKRARKPVVASKNAKSAQKSKSSRRVTSKRNRKKPVKRCRCGTPNSTPTIEDIFRN